MINATTILLQLGRLDEAKATLLNALEISRNQEAYVRASTIENKKNNDAYLAYLSVLIPKVPHINTDSKFQILHLGESHCLAFTNQTIISRGRHT